MENARVLPPASVSGGSIRVMSTDCPGRNSNAEGRVKRNAIVRSATSSDLVSLIVWLGKGSLLSGGARSAFAHVNLSAAILEMRFVHKHIDEEDSSSVLGGKTFANERARHLGWIEAFSFVLDGYQDSFCRVTATAHPNLLVQIVVIAMHNRVGKSFPERGLNRDFVFAGATIRCKKPHKLFHDRIDGFDLAFDEEVYSHR